MAESFFGKSLRGLSNLALDAPLVAILWWLLFAGSIDPEIIWPIPLALFGGVWAIYLFDRLYDASSTNERAPERKRFAKAHPRLLKILLAIAMILAAGAGIFAFEKIWLQSLLIGGATLGYFLFCRWKAGLGNFPLKESLIGLCFAAGAGVPFDWPLVETEICALGVFGALCCLNCLIISKAEAEYDRDSDPSAWFATKDREIPFAPLFALLIFGAVVLVALGLPVIIGATLLCSTLFLWRVSHTERGYSQSLSDAALWIPAAIGAVIIWIR